MCVVLSAPQRVVIRCETQSGDGNAGLVGLYMPTFLRHLLPPSLEVKMEGAASSELRDVTSQHIILSTVMIMSH